jgi:hypothetical protein
MKLKGIVNVNHLISNPPNCTCIYPQSPLPTLLSRINNPPKTPTALPQTTVNALMCRLTRIAYDNCLHIDNYTDRTYDHDQGKKSRYYKGNILECPKVREEDYKIAGMCKSCTKRVLEEETDI